MAGINLSQSLSEKEAQARGSFFDKGFYINLGILLFVLAVFGGVRWYLGTLNQKLADLESQIAAKSVILEGNEVGRVADLRDRLDTIKNNLARTPEPLQLAVQIEDATIPNVRLTKYEENWEGKTVALSGETDNLKYLAQTMLALKKNSAFLRVMVDDLQYNKAGKLEFSLTVKRAVAENK